MSIPTKRWLMWSGAVFAAQLLLFAYIHFFMIGAPHWAEIPYAPFQYGLAPLFGEGWGTALVLGLIIGTLVYSGVFGFILAWVFRRRAR